MFATGNQRGAMLLETGDGLEGRVGAYFHYGSLQDASDQHAHGTHVTGIIAGDGASGDADEAGAEALDDLGHRVHARDRLSVRQLLLQPNALSLRDLQHLCRIVGTHQFSPFMSAISVSAVRSNR